MSKKLHFWLGLSPLILSLAITVAIFTIVNFLPAKLPLFYSLPWGENQLANHQQFLIIPAIITILTLLNLLISWHLHPSQSFFKKALVASSTIVAVILTITFLKIILNFI